MAGKVQYEVIADVSDDPGKVCYARVSVKDRMTWVTKRIAERHARAYKALHLRDAWGEEV